MKDAQTQQQFVALRAQGLSFARIAETLQVSKPTLINWSRKFQFEIQNQRAILDEQLQEKWLANRESRVNALGQQLQQVEAELAKRDLSSLTTAQLFSLAHFLRRHLKQEIGPMRFTTPSAEIPPAEHVYEVQDWNP